MAPTVPESRFRRTRRCGGSTSSGRSARPPRSGIAGRSRSTSSRSSARRRLSEIKYATVRRYETLKLSEKDPLSPGSINKTVQLLAAFLERAYREELIDRNPAKGDRLKVGKPTRAYLDHSDQIDALLRAAAALDAEARTDRRGFARRAIVTTLLFTGVRVGELCSLRWRDIDLANARLRIATSKTDKGVRTIDRLPVLLGELKAHKGRRTSTVRTTSCSPRRRAASRTRTTSVSAS